MIRGSQHNSETRRRISEAKRGKKLTEETRRRISEARLPKGLTDAEIADYRAFRAAGYKAAEALVACRRKPAA